jgi:ubiquinone biosynthesis protein COQ9
MTHPERSLERDTAIEAMLPHVPFDGWTKKALAMGLADAGMPADEVDLLFPLGTADMVATFCDWADRRMEDAAASLNEPRLSRRVKAVMALRFVQNAPYKEAIRRAIGVLALPGNGRTALGCTARTVDAIWYAAGDRSADFSWYTKRAILTAVYGSSVLFWLRDTSADDADTMAFLDRRLAGVARIGRFKPAFLPRLAAA